MSMAKQRAQQEEVLEGVGDLFSAPQIAAPAQDTESVMEAEPAGLERPGAERDEGGQRVEVRAIAECGEGNDGLPPLPLQESVVHIEAGGLLLCLLLPQGLTPQRGKVWVLPLGLNQLWAGWGQPIIPLSALRDGPHFHTLAALISLRSRPLQSSWLRLHHTLRVLGWRSNLRSRKKIPHTLQDLLLLGALLGHGH